MSGQQRPLAIAWVLYLASLALPAILIENYEAMPGYFVLMFGALGTLSAGIQAIGHRVMTPPSAFAWLANPLFLIASILYVACRFRPACVVSAVATLLALTSYTLDSMGYVDSPSRPVTGLGVGFYSWLLAILVLFLASGVRAFPAAEPRSPSDRG